MLGCTEYAIGVDIWSVGCILGELFTKKPIFFQQDESSTAKLIFYVLGSKEEIPLYSKLPSFNLAIHGKMGIGLNEWLKNVTIDPDGFDLLEKMLVLDPIKRISAKEALKHVNINHKI